MRKVEEFQLDTSSLSEIKESLKGATEPLIIKSLVAHWPLVQKAKTSTLDAIQELIKFDNHTPAYTVVGQPDIKGRFFYDEALEGVNFKKVNAAVTATLEQMLKMPDTQNNHAVSIQAASVSNTLPGFLYEHTMPLLADTVEPTIWISNRSRVAPHYDLSHNIACVVTGRRAFTLFPPSQVANLYIGPALCAPGGVPISLVDVKNPDLARFPKYTKALEHAQTAVLEPGDAIFIPSPWWHAVESLESINVLVNYWWSSHTNAHQFNAKNSLMASMLSIANMDEEERLAWREFFDYFVFKTTTDPAEHLPVDLKDLMTTLTDEQMRQCLEYLQSQLSPISD